MIDIKKVCPKPSDALRAMIDGLLEQSHRSDFIIKMQDFGHSDAVTKLCFGCAATCTVQHIAGIDLKAPDINFLGGTLPSIKNSNE